jgi:predicted phage terminase large subunit-like protein
MSPRSRTTQTKDSLYSLRQKIERLRILETRESCQDSLRYFVEAAWPHIDPSPFMANWAIDAVCDHLEAVMLGHIPNLLINIPPRCSKTTIVSIMFPAWVWLRFHDISPLSGPQVRFLCASYSDKLTLLSSNAFRRLVEGEWYQSLFPKLEWDKVNGVYRPSDNGKCLTFTKDQNTKSHMDNIFKGSRQATSVGGSLLGLGGDILIHDDLNNTETEKLVETGAEKAKVRTFLDEFRSTRRNDPREGKSAIIGVQQRTDEGDASGHWAAEEDNLVHLMIPMRHDPDRHNITVKLPQYDDDKPWEDPRDPEGEELMWPERFGEFEVAGLEKALGPIMAAGRLQQNPKTKGGNILKDSYWRLYGTEMATRLGLEWVDRPGAPKEFPHCELTVASLDTAFKEEEENDYNALTIWGIFLDPGGNRKAILMWAWQKRLPLNGIQVSKNSGELPFAFERRQQESWGLVDWVAHSCKKFRVNRLLIEDKSRGHDVAGEIRRQYVREKWGVQLVLPVKDKISRAHSVVPLFADGAIYAPRLRWADDLVIDQCSKFPKAMHDDLVDSVTQFVLWARDNALLELSDETASLVIDEATYRHRVTSVAEQYGV